jgi:homoserine kinase
MGVCVRVPATTANLGPGFDTFGMALALFNTIEAEWTAHGLQIDVTGSGADLVPVDNTNAVYQAMCMVFEKAGHAPLLKERGLRIRIHNEVPVTRGMGSSATAIVGGLWLANLLIGQPFSTEELVQMAVEVEGHPDNVTAAVFGGIVVSGMVRNKVYSRRFTPPDGLQCVVAVPDFQLSTKTSRRSLPSLVSHSDAVHNLNRASLMVTALADNNLEMLCDLMEDRLHEPYRIQLVPGMKEAVIEAKRAGALCTVLSGSGPSVIAFCREGAPKIAAALQAGFQTSGIDCSTLCLSPAEQGVAIVTAVSK